MNVHEILYVSSFQALFLAILVVVKRNKNQPDWFLTAFFILIFLIVQSIISNANQDVSFTPFIFFSLPLTFLSLPVFYWYVEAHNRKLDWKDWKELYHLLPFIISLGLLFFNFYILPVQEKQDIFLSIKKGNLPLSIDVLRYSLAFVAFPYYIYKNFKSLKKHEDYALTRFSYTENIGLSWLNRFMWLTIFIGASFASIVIADGLGINFNHRRPMILPILLGTLGIIYLGVYAIRNNIAFTEIDAESADMELKEKTSKAPSENVDLALYEQKLQQCILEKKPYLNPKLSLKELAHEADIPYYHLSTLLNQNLQVNFYDYINQLRIDEFIRLYQNPENKNFTLLALAYDAGFNSKSSFYDIFKKFKGVSPSQYLKTLSN